jgi:GT2 family glycosyltransferase
MKRISVIILSWNTRELLKGCLNSIRTSGGQLVQEVIVVDNASVDGSTDMVAAQFSDVTLIRSKENLGFARANNLGIERASGSWLALVNSDVVVHPGCFEELVKYLEKHGEAGLVGPAVIGADGRPQPTCRRFPTIWSTACRSLALDNVFSRWPILSGRELCHKGQARLAEVDVLSGCFWMARREAVAQVGGLDERFFFYAEDIDWCKRFWDAGWKVVFVPKATATHLGGGSSANAPLRYSIEMLRANLAYWRKHYGVPGLAIFFFLSVIHHIARLLMRGMEAVLGRGLDSAYKYQRSLVCLRWLLTGKEV